MSSGADPGRDIALVYERARQLKAFGRALEKGLPLGAPLPDLDELRERVEDLKRLAELQTFSQMCAAEGARVGVKAGEVFAHWAIVFYNEDSDVGRKSQLANSALEVDREELKTRVELLAERDLRVAALEQKVGTRLPDDEYETLLDELRFAVNERQRANAELGQLIGPPGHPFDRNENYSEKWQRLLRRSMELADVSRRGVDPDGAALKTLRTRRRWTQARLVEEILAETGRKIAIRTVRRMEAGKRVDLKTLDAVAEAFRVDVDTLKA